MSVLLPIALFSYYLVICVCQDQFIATFQEGITNSDLHQDSHFMEYTGDIPQITNFTACHWMNIKYFSKEFIPIWSYCFVRKGYEDLECLQLSFVPISSSANRDLRTKALLPWSRIQGSFEKSIVIEIKPFRHRTWNHICWMYSGTTGCHDVYYNGDMMKRVCVDFKGEARSKIEGSKNVSNYSFIIGQEQDVLGGSFESRQTFNGNLTDLNIWGKLLDYPNVLDLSKCKHFE